MNNNDIQVSVCIVTYNQQDYIAECLDSLVTQETNFKFEIIVGEDCSTDETRKIIQRYVEKYPDLIIPLFYEKNVGAVENIKQVYKAAKGKYIAHLDGDDFALPNKLQKQFDILEQHPDCSICVHDMVAVDKNSKKMKETFKAFEEKKYKLLDMYLINPFFIHSSKMFVNKLDDYIDFLDEETLDTEVHIAQAKQGDIYYINNKLGVYRQFVGVTYKDKSVNPLIPRRIMCIYNSIDRDSFSEKELDSVYEKYAYILLQYANHYIMNGDFEKAKFYILESRKYKLSILLFLFHFVYFTPSVLSWILRVRDRRVNENA